MFAFTVVDVSEYSIGKDCAYLNLPNGTLHAARCDVNMMSICRKELDLGDYILIENLEK